MLHQLPVVPGVRLHAMQTDKFKTACFSVNFLRPHSARDAALDALLPSVLLRGTERYPDIRSISMRLDDLYGATFGTLVRLKGEVKTTGFYADFIEDGFLPAGEGVFAPVLEFLKEVLYHPLLGNGCFTAANVEGEKQNLINAIESSLNDKRTYAALRLRALMCEGEAYAVPRLGELEDVEQITVVDPYTVSFRLSAPNYAFLEYMTMAILPKHLLEGEDMQQSDFFRAPVGTGPYKLAQWDEGQAIILEKNEDYFAGAAKIDRIIFKIVADDNVKALQLRSGELDLSQVTPKDAALFEDDGVHTVYDETTSDYRGILYNFWNEYWQENADLIPAISCLIDRQQMVDTVLLGKGEVAYGPLQRNVYNDPDMERYDYDPARAEQLLLDAGCQRDSEGYWCRSGQRIGFVINATPGDQVRIDLAQIAAQQLRAAGLEVTANVPAGGIDWGTQQCCIIGWGSPFDADDHTYKVFGTDKGANYSGYSNPKVDEALTQARQTDDPQARKEAYAAFQQALAEAPAYTFFCYIDAVYVADSRIQGISTDTVLGHHGVGIFWNVCDWTIDA